MRCKGRGEKKPTSLSSHRESVKHAMMSPLATLHSAGTKRSSQHLEPYKQEKRVLKPRGGGRPEGCGVHPNQGLPSGLGSSHTETD